MDSNFMIPEDEECKYRNYMDSLFSQIDAPTSRMKYYTNEKVMYTAHPWHGVEIGQAAPDVVHAVIEIPMDSRVRTELDKPTGLLKVDRILHSSIVYPANYGIIPETLGEDGGPLDVLVLCQLSVPPLCLMKARPIGVMPMIEGDQPDDKIIAVCVTDPEYNIYYDITELPPYKMMRINQFFKDYKTLERKTIKTLQTLGAGHAKRIIRKANAAYLEHFQVV